MGAREVKAWERYVIDMLAVDLKARGWVRWRRDALFTKPLAAGRRAWLGLNYRREDGPPTLIVHPKIGIRIDWLENLVADLFDRAHEDVSPPTVVTNAGNLLHGSGNAVVIEIASASDGRPDSTTATRIGELIATVTAAEPRLIELGESDESVVRALQKFGHPGAFEGHLRAAILLTSLGQADAAAAELETVDKAVANRSDAASQALAVAVRRFRERHRADTPAAS